MKMPISTGNEYGIQDVWNSNMEEEFAKIRKIVHKYPYIAMVRVYYQYELHLVVVVVCGQPIWAHIYS